MENKQREIIKVQIDAHMLDWNQITIGFFFFYWNFRKDFQVNLLTNNQDLETLQELQIVVNAVCIANRHTTHLLNDIDY